MLEHSAANYFPHLLVALRFSLRCQVWSLRVAVHAFVPGLFPNTSAEMVEEIESRNGGVRYKVLE